jgi:hypothetical protein
MAGKKKLLRRADGLSDRQKYTLAMKAYWQAG